MNRRLVLKRSIAVFVLIGAIILAFPFVASVAPSTSAKNNADVVLPMLRLEPGKLKVLKINDRNLFILRPNQEQLDGISQLDGYVWNTAKVAYAPELDAYVYWAESTKWGCALQEKPAAESRFKEWNEEAQWFGGYWDPICEVSYDYAGRAIRKSQFTYNGYTQNVPNLAKPKLRLSGDNWVVSLLENSQAP